MSYKYEENVNRWKDQTIKCHKKFNHLNGSLGYGQSTVYTYYIGIF